MRWKPTWLLVCVTALLFGFIYFIERKSSSTSLAPAPPPLLVSIKPETISTIKLERADKFTLRLQKTNQTWNLTSPLFYPAQSRVVDELLQKLAAVTAPTYITPQELASSHNSITNYGLDTPAATLSLFQDSVRTEILFGARTSVGDHIYVQLYNKPGIYVISAEVFDALPTNDTKWRDPFLLNLVGLSLDRMEVRAPGRGFAIQEDQTNHTFYLSKPQVVRADNPKVRSLLEKVQVARVAQFVSDVPRAELESLGLQPCQAELVFGNGTNDNVVVQFGNSPTNDPSLVYARRLSQSNIVLVSKTLLDSLLIPHTELLDRHLFSFAPAELDMIEVAAAEKFTLRRQTNGLWTVTEPQVASADPEMMRDWLMDLERLEGNVEKDVVTDFTTYALAQPARQYSLKASFTNASGLVTNRLLSQLDIGGVSGEKIFVRRADENSVYSISFADFNRLPAAAWQLRDRRVWSFTTNEISRVTVRHRGMTRQWDRSPTGQWRFAEGSQGILDNRQFALEETMYRLGELRAIVWLAKGEQERERYGFTEDGYKMSIDLKNGARTNTLTLEFGGQAPAKEGQAQEPYAMATVDGQIWIFEFPFGLFIQVLRDFSNPVPVRNSAAATP